MKFTDKSIQSLKPKQTRYEIWEGGKSGFGLRVTPKGVKSFVWMYRFDGRARRLTLGNYPKMTLHEANKALVEAKTKLLVGDDPGEDVVEQRIKDRNTLRISELVEEYINKYSKPKKRSSYEEERILKKDLVPHFGNKKANKLNKRDINQLLDAIVSRGAPIAANAALACIRKMYNWAVDREIVKLNPCSTVKRPSEVHHRDRVLSKNEIKSFWTNLDKTNISTKIRLVLKLQLVTSQRKGELLAARWVDFDFNNNIWTIPIENSKNKLSHRVPLSSLALELLDNLKKISSQEIYLFGSKNNQVIRGSSVDHALRNNRHLLEVDNVTPHDLRRTAASHMASKGINRLVISKILNHSESSVTSIYDRYSYDKEKKEALDIWGAYLVKLIESKV